MSEIFFGRSGRSSSSGDVRRHGRIDSKYWLQEIFAEFAAGGTGVDRTVVLLIGRIMSERVEDTELLLLLL